MSPDQEKILTEIRDAVTGNPATGNKGLLSRVETLEANKLNALTGVAATLALIYPLFELFKSFH